MVLILIVLNVYFYAYHNDDSSVLNFYASICKDLECVIYSMYLIKNINFVRSYSMIFHFIPANEISSLTTDFRFGFGTARDKISYSLLCQNPKKYIVSAFSFALSSF